MQPIRSVDYEVYKKFQVFLPSHHVAFVCSWRLNDISVETRSRTIDVILSGPTACPMHLSVKDHSGAYFAALGTEHLQRFDNPKDRALSFFLDAFLYSWNDRQDQTVALKIILPAYEGFIIQSDFLERRLIDCEYVVKTVGFMTVGQYVPRHKDFDSLSYNFLEILNSAVGGILIKNGPETVIDRSLDVVESQLAKRISFDWLAPHRPLESRLALVGGCDTFIKMELISRIAKSLGIKLVVLDFAGPWVEDPNMSDFWENFLPCDISPTGNLPGRIVDTLRTYGKHVDGIVAFYDRLLVPVAKAAVIMGLGTEPPSAFELATNKYKTRASDLKYSQLFRIAGPSDLEEILLSNNNDLVFPLVVKPRLGFASRGVYKIHNVEELREAVARNSSTSFMRSLGPEQVIETYIDGPEVDANMILLDGEILFFEVNDDFPSDADNDSSRALSSFLETGNLIPSNLPQTELACLRKKLHQSLLLAGFRSGFFHMEARMVHSKFEFSSINGLVDLRPKSCPSNEDADVFLLEINARPPAILDSNAISRVYGIDYWAVFLLNAVKDHPRMRALSRPFSSGAQYYCEIVYIGAQAGGTFYSDDVCTELKQRCPDLAPSIVDCYCFLHRGMKVADPETGVHTFLAGFLVHSRRSREDALFLGQRIREEIRYEIL